MPSHKPVLLNEVLSVLGPEPGGIYIDATVGLGGHAFSMLEACSPDGRLLGIDRDPRNLALAEESLAVFGDRVAFVRDSYANAAEQARRLGFSPANGILLDLGYSSVHVDEPERGFSFQNEGPLDMRYDPDQELDAASIVNGFEEEEIARILRVYGEERLAGPIAEAIIRGRPFRTTTQLASAIEAAAPRRGKIHPATKTFQALRIAVNDELGELERALPQLADLLAPGGRIAVISFHSLEDRLVKRFIKEHKNLTNLTKNVVTASPEEAKSNPRARSAKLRAAERH